MQTFFENDFIIRCDQSFNGTHLDSAAYFLWVPAMELFKTGNIITDTSRY